MGLNNSEERFKRKLLWMVVAGLLMLTAITIFLVVYAVDHHLLPDV